MSGRTIASTSTHTPSTSSYLAAPRTDEDPDNVDVRLDLLIRNILPKSPYLLDIPTDRPNPVRSYQQDNWRLGSPFAAHEGALQYMTFLSREWDDGLLVARGNWEQNDVMDTSAISSTKAQSGTSTPVNGKSKKITLNDYKTKPKSGTPGPSGGAKDMANGVSVREPVKDTPKISVAQSSPQRGEKRTLEAMHDGHAAAAPFRTSASPAKKVRRSPSPNPRADGETAVLPMESPDATAHGLPPLLSPTLPAYIEEELSRFANLPPLGETGGSKNHSRTSSSSDTKLQTLSRTSTPSKKARVPDKNLLTSSKTTGTTAAKGLGLVSSKVRGDTDGGPREVRKAPLPQESKGRSDGAEAGGRSSQSGTKGGAPIDSEGRKRRLVVKLKYGRGRRKDVQRILNISARPKKVLGDTQGSVKEVKAERDREQDGLSQRDNTKGRSQDDRSLDKGKLLTKGNALGTTQERREARADGNDSDRAKAQHKSGEKRPRITSDERATEPPTKRHKVPESLDVSKKPRTPLQPPFRSPALSVTGSGQKSQASTPMNNSKSTAMRRVDSSEARTPKSARTEATAQPRGGEPASTDGKPQGSGSGRSKEVDAWKAEYKRFLELGRQLKHHAQETLRPKTEGAPVEEQARKQGAALAVESVLCWMLAFAADDEIHHLQKTPAEVGNWRSLMPFWKFVEGKCRAFRHLHGLALQLGAVCHETIHALDIERFHKDTLPDMSVSTEAAPPTPGAAASSNESTASSSEKENKAAAYKRDYLKWKNDMVKDARDLRLLWIDGLSELSVDDLQTHFPKTWAKRNRVPAAKEKEKLVPGQYGGSYYLPLGSVSTVLEAVRTSMAALSEWTEREDASWTSRLGFS